MMLTLSNCSKFVMEQQKLYQEQRKEEERMKLVARGKRRPSQVEDILDSYYSLASESSMAQSPTSSNQSTTSDKNSSESFDFDDISLPQKEGFLWIGQRSEDSSRIKKRYCVCAKDKLFIYRSQKEYQKRQKPKVVLDLSISTKTNPLIYKGGDMVGLKLKQANLELCYLVESAFESQQWATVLVEICKKNVSNSI